MMYFIRSIFGAAVCGALLACRLAHAEELDVQVHVVDDQVLVDVKAEVPVSRDIAWTVMTDYERMPDYNHNLTLSKILSRKDNLLQVQQVGSVRHGPWSFAFDTIRSVELTPQRQIKSSLVRGDFKSYQLTTTLTGEPGGPVTIVNHGEYVPNRWIPPVVGPALIQSETRKQYQEMIEEMKRRERLAAAKP